MLLLGLSILRYNPDTPEPIMLTQSCELSSFGFFQRGSVKEMITFFAKTIAKRTPPGQRQSVQNEVDKEYPPRVAFSLLSKIMEDFSTEFPAWLKEMRNEAILWPALDQAVVKYQDPSEADQIMRIQRNLDETKDILHNTIDTVLERGEKLEDLVDRSGELSQQSKLFYKQAKRTNSCCAVV